MKFPKGKYYIGDLCYVLTKREWGKVCEFNDDNGFLNLGKKQIWLSGTKDGDGIYKCGETDISVDSGTIGIISIDFLSKKTIKAVQSNNLGLITYIEQDFEPSEHTGVFLFGALKIDTGDVDD